MSSTSLKKTFRRKFLPLVILVILFLVGAIPVTYYSLAKNDLESQADIHASQIAKIVRKLVEEKPRFWKYDMHLYLPIYQDFISTHGVERITIFDDQGNLISSSDEKETDQHTIYAIYDLIYNNRVVGQLRVDMSTMAIRHHTLLILLISSAMGTGIGLLLFLWPVRVIGNAEEALVAQVQSEAEVMAWMRAEQEHSQELIEANTALAHANARANMLVNQLEEKNKELETFVYTVSHDLKSPVVALQGMAGILLEDYQDKLDAQGKHYLNRLTANANQMELLIRDLLELSRIGRINHPPEKLDLNPTVKEIIDRCYIRFPNTKVEVSLAPLPMVLTDRVRIQQVFENLLTNAFKFMGHQPHPRVEIGVKEDGETYTFWVKDNGIGIDPAYQEKIFGTFQRLQEVEVEGTGVGLTIVKRVVEGMGGKMWVESEKGKGATFYFIWPNHQNGGADARA